MLTKKQLKKIEGDLADTRMLYNVMLDALKYYEMETTQCTSIIYLCKIINERFGSILNEIDENFAINL
jgi:hypothetical protein